MAASVSSGAELLHSTLRALSRSLDGDPEAAAQGARQLIAADPSCPPAHRLLGAALRRLGRGDEADRAELDAVEVATKAPDLVEAAALVGNREYEQAEVIVRARLRSDPDDAAALAMLAEIAGHFGYLPEAEKILRRALELAPAFRSVQLSLAATVHRRKRTDEALALIEDILRKDPDQLDALGFKAAMLVEVRRLDEGIATYEQILARAPTDPLRWMNYAFLLKTIGRLDQSIAAYRKSLELKRSDGAGWWNLANLKTVTLTADDIATMEQALGDPQDETSRIQLHFALGKALGDQGRFAESFTHYEAGNRLRRAQLYDDAGLVTDDVRKVEKLFTSQFFGERTEGGSAAPDPIFIIGMHRAGSTLVEQILDSHSAIEGTEELFDIQRLAGRVGGSKGQGPSWLDNIALLSVNELLALGETYLQATRSHRKTDRPYFTDKMPGNWLFAGLIHLILPNAKIIDVRRHPLGCCFANFAQYYPTGLNFAFDLRELGLYYRDYVRLMAHFDRELPGRIHRVFYEDLVQDVEAETRRLLDYLGLPFEETCLRFYENPRAVLTPSSEQVRRPINRQGMETWRNYELWLGPLKEALGPVLDLYPEVPGDWPV